MSRTTFKKAYDFFCAKCGKKQWAKPSMMMTDFGINSGHGNCLFCKTFLHLTIVPDLTGECMASKTWPDYLKEQGIPDVGWKDDKEKPHVVDNVIKEEAPCQ